VNTQPPVTPIRVVAHPGDPGRPTLVFIHGVYHGSWAFEEFRKPFVDTGYPVALVDLRRHEGEPRAIERSHIGLDTHTDDIGRALDRIAGPKVLVGHSLGALLAMSLATRTDVAGNVLIAPPTPGAVRAALAVLFFRFPLRAARFMLLGRPSALYHHGPFIDRYLLSEHTRGPVREAAHRAITSRHEPHSVFLDAMTLRFPNRDKQPPTLILIGERDPTVTPRIGQRLRSMTGGDLVVIPRAGHDIMLEPGGPIAFNTISNWLDAGLNDPERADQTDPPEPGGSVHI